MPLRNSFGARVYYYINPVYILIIGQWSPTRVDAGEGSTTQISIRNQMRRYY